MGLLPPAPRGPARPEDVPFAEKSPSIPVSPRVQRAIDALMSPGFTLADVDRVGLAGTESDAPPRYSCLHGGPGVHEGGCARPEEPRRQGAVCLDFETVGANPFPPPEPDAGKTVSCLGVGKPLVFNAALAAQTCPDCPGTWWRQEGPTPEHHWENGEFIYRPEPPAAEKPGVAALTNLVRGVEIKPEMFTSADKSGVSARAEYEARFRPHTTPPRAGVGLPPLGDAPVVAQILPDVPPWPELDQGPPGSCPGVGKPLVRRYPPPSYPSCAWCEMSWADMTVAPEHPAGNCLTDQHLRRLDTWARAAGGLLGQLRRRVLDLIGRDVGEELDRRFQGLELGKAGVTVVKAATERIAALEALVLGLAPSETISTLERRVAGTADRVMHLENRTSGLHEPARQIASLDRRLSELERAATDAQARPGFVRGHLAKALRHIAALVEKPK